MNSEYTKYIFLALPLVIFLTNRIPFVGKFLRIINTLIHESGHALLAVISSGEVYEVELFSDRSGSATTKTNGTLSRFMVAFAGYPFAAGMGYLFFLLVMAGKSDIVLYILMCFSLINLALLVRNKYGIFWLITFFAVLLMVVLYANAAVKFYFNFWLIGIILFESLYSCFELLKIASKKPKSSGDAANLEKFTGIPAMVWAVMFLLVTLGFILLSVDIFFPFI
jgi:hypothetical protein